MRVLNSKKKGRIEGAGGEQLSVDKYTMDAQYDSVQLLLFGLILQLLFARESFMKTKAAPEHVISGWEPKVNATAEPVISDSEPKVNAAAEPVISDSEPKVNAAAEHVVSDSEPKVNAACTRRCFHPKL